MMPFAVGVVGMHEYVCSVAGVCGRSMLPTFNVRDDHVLCNKLSAALRTYGRGDVVILRSPETNELITKRVIAMEDDIVCSRDGESVVEVPRGHLWVEGDNAHLSNDSNAFGCVDAGKVEARVDYRVWPLSEAGPVERVEPPRDRVYSRSAVAHALSLADSGAL